VSEPVSVLLELIRQHAEDDTRRFAAVERKLDAIATDVRSLVESRTLARGAWKATALVASGVAGMVSVLGSVVAWLLR
jgi:hypothetical protein